MKTLFPLTMAALLVTGCSSTSVPDKQNDPIVDALTGKPPTYVEQKLGLPQKREDTRSGSMVWIYIDNEKGADAKGCTVTLSIRNDKVEHVVVDAENESLFSVVTGKCQRIRADLGV